MSITFTPTSLGGKVGSLCGYTSADDGCYATFRGYGVATTTASVSATALNFGTQKLNTLSTAQSFTIENSTAAPLDISSMFVSGANPEDFTVSKGCGPTIASGVDCTVYVVFTPRGSGNRSAYLQTPLGNGTQVTVTLTGTGMLAGRFQIFNAQTAKVLEVTGASSSNGTLIQQNALNGNLEQQWEFIPVGNGAFQIANVLGGRVLDVVAASTTDGTQVQQFDYLGGTNQQWRLTPVDDVHYASVNVNSGKVLDIPGGTTANETPVQQWGYSGNQQQLWVLLPLTHTT